MTIYTQTGTGVSWKKNKTILVDKANVWTKCINVYAKDSVGWKRVYTEGIVGSVIASINHLAGYETPDECWQSCDGSLITDNQSPLKGQYTPDLNGDSESTKLFLFGSTVSGSGSGAPTHGHNSTSSVSADSRAIHDNWEVTVGFASNANIPPYMEVKYYLRIK